MKIEKNKILLIIILVIILFCLIFFGFLFWPKKRKIAKPIIKQTVPVKQQKDFIIPKKNITVYKPIKSKDCQNITDPEKKKWCWAEMELRKAVSAKDPRKCLDINFLETRDRCLFHIIGTYIQNVQLCQAIIAKDLRENCIDMVTRQKKDPRICYEFYKGEPFELAECLDRVKAFQIAESKEKDDILECKNIKTLEYPNLCYLHSFKNKYNNNCRQVPDELKELCNAVMIANYGNDVKMCEHITIPEYKEYCYLRFKVGGGDVRGVNKYDTDKDGVGDGDELFYGTNINNSDTDQDGLSDGEEIYKYHSNPKDKDTDQDGLNDKEEITTGTDINNPDTDHDGILDGQDDDPLNRTQDKDGDYLTDEEEAKWGTDPNKKDTDGDGASDWEEIQNGTNPVGDGWQHDADNDGLIDADERFYGTDPLNPDTDGDGYKDGEEVKAGFNPLGEGKLNVK